MSPSGPIPISQRPTLPTLSENPSPEYSAFGYVFFLTSLMI